MNRSSFALFVALLIHFVLLVIFWYLGSITPEVKKQHKEEKKIKISLKEMPARTLKKKSADSGVVKKKQISPKTAPPMPKGKQLKQIQQQEIKPYVMYKKKETTVTPIKKVKIPPIFIDDKQHSSKYIELKKKPADPMAWMSEDRSSEEKEKKKKKKTGSAVGLANKSIKELYGSKFGELSEGQQKYILDNQEIMRRITQQVLTRVARVNLRKDLNVNRTNVIEFYLHPNGDMTDFKFLKNSGYIVLDNTTQETIEYAYSRYPRPSEKTLIRYNVYYNLRAHR